MNEAKRLEDLPPADGAEVPPHLILGTGDNFAPAINARWLDGLPDKTKRAKEANTWDWVQKQWEPVWKKLAKTVQADIAAGRGYLATDNVGCFLKAAQYDAVVPGVHDFYFGSERLRYLARFLATPDTGGHVVEMLAANLVIQTSFTNAPKPVPDSDRRLPFATKYPGLTLTTIKDGKPVLPWLQHFDVIAAAPGVNDPVKPWRPEFRLCRAKRDDPSTIEDCPYALDFKCRDPKHLDVSVDCPAQLPPEKDVDFRVSMPALDTLEPDSNYAVCLPGLPKLKPYQPLGFCTRFSVYIPFFQYPNSKPQPLPSSGQNYGDPLPFLLKENVNGRGLDVAVFGVVDPALRGYIGEVNDSWANTDSKYKTEVQVLDPAEALSQQLQYFNRWYQEHHGGKFAGMRILLAQMSPPLARQLAAKLQAEFNLVISEADTEQVTPNGIVEVDPLHDDHSKQGTVNKTPTFVAVPPSYVDGDTPVLQLRALDLLHVAPPQRDKQKWRVSLFGDRKSVPPPVQWPIPPPDPRGFDHLLEAALARNLENEFAHSVPVTPTTKEQRIKNLESLTLVTLKKRFHADIALMQKRDFYFGQAPDLPPNNDESYQFKRLPPGDVLERILWKGDLAILIMVKGSTLVKVLQESAQFDAQDNQTLSLELTKDRGVLPLGIFHDPLRDEYLVNGEVLDPNRLYSVATTDYIGLGDTGYPEIVEPGFDNPQVVGDFPRQLSRISSLVCMEIGGQNCQAPFAPANDLDELSTTPLNRGPSLNAYRQFLYWTHIPYLLHPGSHPQESRDLLKPNPVELTVQDRRVWFFSHSSTVAYSAVNNNVSVVEQKADFSAINNPPQLQAKQSHDVSFNLLDSTGYKGRQVDFYFQPQIDFENVVTAQAVPPALSNLKQNGLDGELGFFLHRPRDYPRIGAVLSARDETQLLAPSETVTLADAQRSTLNFSHDRTNWLFGHIGFRAQNRHSYFEGGFEVGDARRVTAFNFTGPAGTASCPFAATPTAQDEPACVTADSSGTKPSITKQSVGSASIGSAFRYGWYSKMQLTVPIQTRLAYVFTNTFDYFYAGNNSISTDMLYRDLWSNQFSIKVTRNVSVAPKFDVLFYENQVEHNFFRQVQTSVSLKYAFDWYSGSRWKTVVRYTEPKPQ